MQYTNVKHLYVLPCLLFVLFTLAFSQSGRDVNKRAEGHFGKVAQPFHVVLMVDTNTFMFGANTLIYEQFKEASFALVEQLQNEDRVKIISFDNKVHTLSDFTNDKGALKKAITKDIRPGLGKKLYDAMDTAIADLEKVQGRKAIIIITDGVDWHSDYSTYKKNRDKLEKAGIIVYPILCDTRETLERIVKRAGGYANLEVIFTGESDTTKVIYNGQSGTIRIYRPRTTGQPSIEGPTKPTTTGSNGNIEAEIDRLYSTADAYVKDLADVTGGRLYRPDKVTDLPAAFAKIADELRTQ